MKELEQTTQSVPKGRRFCTICGEVKRERYFEGDSTHCSACCEKMLHTRLSAACIPVVLVLLAAVAVSVFLSVYTVPYCTDLFRAEAMRRDNRISEACDAYSTVVSNATDVNALILAGGKTDDSGSVPAATRVFFEAGARTWARYLDAYASIYSEYEAADLASGSLDKRAVTRIPAIRRYKEVRQAYDDVLAFAEETANKHPAGEDADEETYDAIVADLTAYADESDSDYVKGYVEYYKGRAAQYFKDDPSIAIAFYEKMLDYLPNEFMTAYTAEAQAAFAAGEYETVIEAYEKMLEKNRNYTAAYPAIAEAAFYAGDDEKLASVLDRYEENDPLRLRMEMRFALRGDDLEEAAAVRERARQTIRVQADEVFNKMLSDQTIDSQGRTFLMNYIAFALEDASLSLVKGDVDEAFRIVYEEAFNYAYYYSFITNDSTVFTQSLLNMATLCASLKGDESAIKTINEVGFCDTVTQQVIDDKMSMREVFVEGKAEVL